MMITITCPIKQDFIIELLNGATLDKIHYTFKQKDGMKLLFEYSGGEREAAIRLAKARIKETEIGHVLFFQIV